MAKTNLYTIGGTVQAGGGLYITRQADEELFALCQACTFAYVLTSRQMGKSSLMVRTAERLAGLGIHSVSIDLTQIGVQVTADEWYLGLLTTIADRLALETEVSEWWSRYAHLSRTQRLMYFFQEILLAESAAPVVIFIDEIDSTINLPFTDDFYAAVRAIYNARALVPAWQRLTFVLIGVAAPSDLISDPQRTPFNIGQRVDLTDFTFEEALPLADGFGLPPDQTRQALRWVLHWTGGHPYLTQRLCRALADAPLRPWSAPEVQRVVARTFFGERSEQDHNLQFVRDMLTKRAADPMGVLTTYGAIRLGRRPVHDEEQSLLKAHLKLSGIVRPDNGVLRVRNPLYATVFDRRWLKSHQPVNWKRRLQRAAIGLSASFLLAAFVYLGLFIHGQRRLAEEQRRLARVEAAARIEAEKRRQEVEQAMQEVNQAMEAETKAHAEAEKQRLRAEQARREAEYLAGLYIDSMAQNLAVQVLRQDEQYKRVDEASALLAYQAYLFHQRGAGRIIELVARALHTVLEAPFDRVLNGHEGEVTTVAVSPDGRTVASGGADQTVRLWGGGRPWPPPRVLRGHEAMVQAVKFSPDGYTLASGSADQTIRLWDLRLSESSPMVLRGHEEAVYSVAFSPDGYTLASGSADQTIRLWDLLQPGASPTVLRGHEASVSSVAFSPDGRLLASDGFSVKREEKNPDLTIRLWDLRQPNIPSTVLSGHTNNVHGVAFSPDGYTLVSGSADTTVRLWELREPTPLSVVLRAHDMMVEAVAFSPDGQTLASGGGDQTIRLWNIRHPATPPIVLRGHEGLVWAVAFSPEGDTLASGSRDQTVRLWTPRQSSTPPTVLRGHAGEVLSVAFSPDGQILASGSEDRTVQLWDLRQPGVPPTVLRGHEEGVWTVAFSPDGQILASGSSDHTVRLWDLHQPGISPTILYGHRADIHWLAFSPDGRTLASGSVDKTVRLWNPYQPDTPPVVLNGHNNRVPGLAFSPNGNTLISIDYSDIQRASTMLLWDRRQPDAPRFAFRHEGGGVAVAFSPDGQTLASGGQDIRLWNTRLSNLLETVCNKVWRNLTLDEWNRLVSRDLPYERTCPDLPAHPSLLETGKNLARQGDVEGALRLLQRVVELDTSPTLEPQAEVAKLVAAQRLIKEANQLQRAGNIEGAAALLQRAQELDPDVQSLAALR